MQNILKMTLKFKFEKAKLHQILWKDEELKQEGREDLTKKIGPTSLLLPTLLILKIHISLPVIQSKLLLIHCLQIFLCKTS